MTACVYLIQNRDLYKIGRSENFQKRLKNLRPCNVIQVYETDRSRDLEIELHRKYKHCRLPGTEYFRLHDKEVDEVCVALGVMDKLPETVEPRPQPEWRKSLRKGLARVINEADFNADGISNIDQVRAELRQEYPEYF